MKPVTHISSISEMLHMLGVEDIRHPLVEIVDMERVVNAQAFSHLTATFGFYMVVYKECQCGPLTYGLSTYDYDNGTLLFVAPHQEFSVQEVGQARGKMLLFSPDLLERTLLDTMMHRYTFFSYAVNEALHISEREKEQFYSVLTQIEDELEHAIDKYSNELVVTHIQLLLAHCLRYYDRQFVSRAPVNVEYGDQFKRLLTEYYNTDTLRQKGLPHVSYFADQLHMSANYFGDMIKKSLGVSPSQYIQDYVISLAKQQLRISKRSISDIAYDLGFEYPQYFTRLFKKSTGQTPIQFRNQSIEPCA